MPLTSTTSPDLVRALDSALASDVFDTRTLVPESSLDNDLARACDLARDLARRSLAQQVNASGADLSALEIERIEILEGVTWTDQTRWPAGIKELVRETSEEIGDGVYQVRTGDTPDRSYVPLM